MLRKILQGLLHWTNEATAREVSSLSILSRDKMWYSKWIKLSERKVSRILDESQKFSRWMFNSALAFCSTLYTDKPKTTKVFPTLGWNPVNHETFLSLDFCRLQYVPFVAVTILCVCMCVVGIYAIDSCIFVIKESKRFYCLLLA